MRNLLLASTILFAMAGPALAREAPKRAETSAGVELVYFQAAELATDDGVRALRQRVRRAAERACDGPLGYLFYYDHDACVAPATRDGLAQLDRVVTRWREGAFAGTGSLTIRAR